MDWQTWPPFLIDFNYDAIKAGVGVGTGYDARPAGAVLRGVIWHTTNGVRGSSFASEARYLRDSPIAKAHYLVGKDGRITRILDLPWRAWHAGVSGYGLWTDLNDCTVGVECHHAIGDVWPAVQLAACAWLFRTLKTDHPSLSFIATHRAVALPPGRKSDPDDLTDSYIAGFVAAL